MKMIPLSFVKICVGVHDSFWTHACDVDTMNRILREKFVELYSVPILENVSLSTKYLLAWKDYFILPQSHSFGDLDAVLGFGNMTANYMYSEKYIYWQLLFFLLIVSDNLQLLENFETSYPALAFPPLPQRGDFELEEVLVSPYFFNWVSAVYISLLGSKRFEIKRSGIRISCINMHQRLLHQTQERTSRKCWKLLGAFWDRIFWRKTSINVNGGRHAWTK